VVAATASAAIKML